jgi:exonuclease SbcC
MIKAHYKLVTDTGKGKLIYETIPDFKALENISLIEAPNDSGKSTLLHCLAISCYGEQTQYIKDKITDPGLLEKIDWLINPSLTNVAFDITIEAHGTIFSAKKEINRQDIERFIDGNRATFEDFKEKFNIVYQIPSDPVRRLKDIIADVKNNINYYGGLLSGHHENIGKIIENLDQDPKDRIKKIQERINKLDEKNNTLLTRLGNVKDERVAIEKYLPILQIENYNKILNTLNDKKATLEEQIKSSRSKAKARSKTTEQIKSFNEEIIEKTKNYLDIIERLDLGNVDINNNITILNNINILDDFKSNKGETYWDTLTTINEAIQDLDEVIVDENKADNSKYLEELKSFLETFPTSLDNESITTPVDVLLKEIKKYLSTFSDSEFKKEFENIYSIFSEIDELVDSGVRLYKDYKDLPEADKDTINKDGIRSKIKILKDQISEISKSNKTAEAKLVSYGIEDQDSRDMIKVKFLHNFPKYNGYRQKKLEEELEKLTSSMKNIEEENTATEIKIQTRENEIEDLKDKERDEFADSKEKVEKIESILHELKYRLENELIVYLETQEVSNGNDNAEEKFKEQLQLFLAKKIPEIPVKEDGIELKLKVKKIDYLKKIFITEDDKKIDFRMYGTGRTSSLGYLSTINNLNPEKLSILLLDEALMDDLSIAPLREAMNKQYSNGILFAGILARYSKTVNVKSLVNE